MPRFMLDTDVSSYIMKRTNVRVLEKTRSVPLSDLCISAVIKSELELGVALSPRKAKDRAALDDFLKDMLVLDYPGDAASEYADIRSYLHLRGTIIGANDMLIASHARFLGLTLVTNNVREFQRVPGLRIENWAAPVN
jgi:tRNA(fMet)-specific endonuclease VapC